MHERADRVAPRGHRGRGCRGQSVPLAALFIWLMAGLGLMVVHAGAGAASRARAQSAADAVALGAAADPEQANALATANNARITSLTLGEARVDAAVEHTSGVAAVAAASRPRPEWHNLDPRVVAALAAAEALLGEPVPVVSGFRSYEEQLWLWEHRDENPYPVAYPGTSDHERGLAVDVALDFVGRLRSVSDSVGLCQPLAVTDPVHFRLCVPRPTR